jgi:serine/threonine protein kinase
MAPEQCQGRDVQASADIYSLSVIVYQMFCGCLPFEARTLAELLHKQIAELPTPPAVRDPGISKRVSEAILSGLAKAPEDRPPSAAAFAARLRGSTEAELKLLADGKVVANNYGNSFFPLLLACFVPYIPIMAGLYLAMRSAC